MSLKDTLNTYRGLPREIYILFIGKIVNSIGAFVHPLMTLILTQKIGLTSKEAGYIITLLAICQVPSLILGGKLSDKIGRRKVIITFQLLGAICLLICGFINPSIEMAYIIILSSCFYSISSPAYDALNADLTTSENRQKSYSLLYMGVNIGFAIGPILGGMLYNDYLNILFIGDAVTTLISLGLFIKFIPETMNKQKNIEVGLNRSILDTTIKEDESTFKVLLKIPILILFSLVMLTYQFGYTQIGFTLPIQLEELFGQNGASIYGFVAGINGLAVIILTPILTNITKKNNPIKIMSLGGIFYGVSFLMFGIVKSAVLFYIIMFIMTIGEVLVAINQGAFIANRTPISHRGRISSILPLIMGVGRAIGPSITGSIIYKYSMLTGWIIVSAIVITGAIIMNLLVLIDKQIYEDVK